LTVYIPFVVAVKKPPKMEDKMRKGKRNNSKLLKVVDNTEVIVETISILD
jgi:hypothetical protein